MKSGVEALQLDSMISAELQAAALVSKPVTPLESGPGGVVYVIGLPAMRSLKHAVGVAAAQHGSMLGVTPRLVQM